MKPGFTGLSLSVLMLAMVPTPFAQDTSVNVNSFVIPELSEVPVIDGDLSDAVWNTIPEIPMDKDGDSPAAEPGTGDLDIVLKVAWDEETNALYLHVDVTDESFINVQGRGSSAGDGGWRNERLEVVIDGSNSGSADSTTTSGLHQQYTFDMPNNWDENDPDNGLYGSFDTGGLAVSTDFVSVPGYERIEGSVNVTNDHYPFNIADEFLESAVRIRALNPDAVEWLEQPVNFTWEIKLVPFDFLLNIEDLGYDISDPALVESGWLEALEDDAHIVLDLEENEVIGFSPQMNDADVFDLTPAREHQTNTTGFAGNWNSSENLTGLILGPPSDPGTSVADWAVHE